MTRVGKITKSIAAAMLGMSIMTAPVVAYATEGDVQNENLEVIDSRNTEVNTVETIEETEDEDTQEKVVIPQNNTVKSGDKTIKSTLPGNYYAQCVPGFAVITPEAELQKQANFMVLEYFFVTTWDIDSKTAPAAVETMDIVAQSEGAELEATFQMTVNRLFSTKVYPMENENVKVGTMIEIPGIYKKEGASYAMVCVRAGGKYEILPDLDDDPDTITFNAHAGTGAYGIIRYFR